MPPLAILVTAMLAAAVYLPACTTPALSIPTKPKATERVVDPAPLS